MSLIVALTSLTPLIAPNSWKIWLYCNYVTLLYRLGRGGEEKGGVSLSVWSTDVGVCSALPPLSLSPPRAARAAGVLLEQCHDHRFFAQRESRVESDFG